MSILAFPSAGMQCKTATKLYFKGLIESRIVVKVLCVVCNKTRLLKQRCAVSSVPFDAVCFANEPMVQRESKSEKKMSAKIPAKCFRNENLVAHM